MTSPHQRTGAQSGPHLRRARGTQRPKHKVGWSQGASSPIVNVRLPLALLARLARYIERREGQTGSKTTRSLIVRWAIEHLLETEEPVDHQTIVSPPLPECDTFYQAYLAVGHGRNFVRIHRLRSSLAWSRDRFDTVVRQLAAASVIELHEGDPSRMTAAEIADSYQEPGGMLSLCMSWRGERSGRFIHALDAAPRQEA
jgi:hypothetical protein